MRGYAYEQSLTTECACGADIGCEIAFGIDGGEAATRDCPGSPPSIDGFAVKADAPTCSECGASTEPAVARLEAELDRDSAKAWDLLHGDRIYHDARPYDY